MILKLSAATKIALDGFTAYLYNSKKDSPNLSAVYVDCHSHHARVAVKSSIRAYFVIDGTGEFDLGPDTYRVGPSDLVIIPPRTPYAYRGRMKLFEVNTPATDASDETAA